MSTHVQHTAKFPWYERLEKFIPGRYDEDGRVVYPGSSFVDSANDYCVAITYLSTYLIRIDGKYEKEEKQFVYDHLLELGIHKHYAESATQFMLFLLQQGRVPYDLFCEKLKKHFSIQARLQVFHFLCELAHTDQEYVNAEHKRLQVIGYNMGLDKREMKTIIHSYLEITLKKQQEQEALKKKAEADRKRRRLERFLGNRLESAYRLLGLSPDCSNQELKDRYRQLVRQHHPDRFVSMGPKHVEKATERFKEIQAAYDKIEAARK